MLAFHLDGTGAFPHILPVGPTAIPEPLFVLGVPRSFTSVVAAMLGQHPEMYGVPETQLFSAETIAQWWDLCSASTFPMADGLLRAIAEVFLGTQTDATIQAARGWLRRRAAWTTGLVLEAIAAQVAPRALVEKSPSVVYSPESLLRCYNMFPRARFLHLVRHPRGQAESVLKALRDMGTQGPPPHWLVHLACYSEERTGLPVQEQRELDPQLGWYALNQNVRNFLHAVPAEQQLQVRGEDVLCAPLPTLRGVAEWLGLRTDDEALHEMTHPERSPFACLGPRDAKYGNDPNFLESPRIRASHAPVLSLEGPLSWHKDGREFLPHVKRFARDMGYE